MKAKGVKGGEGGRWCLKVAGVGGWRGREGGGKRAVARTRNPLSCRPS